MHKTRLQRPLPTTIAISLLAAAALAACGGGGGGGTSPASTAATTEVTVVDDPAQILKNSRKDSTSSIGFIATEGTSAAPASTATVTVTAAPASSGPTVATAPATPSTSSTSSTSSTTVSMALTATATTATSPVGSTTQVTAPAPAPVVMSAPVVAALVAAPSVVAPAPAPAPVPTAQLDSSLKWSDTATWGGVLPTVNAQVVIPAGKTIVLDTDPPPLAGVRIEGTLRFARRDTRLTTTFIDVSGALEIGSAAAPFQHKAVITLNGAPQAANDGVSRGINVRGGRLEIYGAAKQPAWTKINDHAATGATSLTLKESVRWQPGDVLAIAPTDYISVAQTERIALASADAERLTLTAPLASSRWGKLQYVTHSGMSLTADPAYRPPVAPAPTVLDERAAVANLTRNVVIEGADDTAWQTNGFGAHLMIMDLRSKVVLDGLEMRRAGQAGVMGRYPIHWHMLSYSSTGSLLGDASGHVLRNSTIWNSSQRCVVLHGTNGVQVLNNICHDIKGHAFFLEDAVERRNVLEGNVALKVRAPAASQVLQLHEKKGSGGGGGPSGFWLTNPDNAIRQNLAADTEGTGFWMAFPRKPLGASSAVPLVPDRLPPLAFDFNYAHSTSGPGIMLDFVPVDAAGNVKPNKFVPTSDGTDAGKPVRFQVKGNVSFKNQGGAYLNRVSWPDYVEWVVADNVGVQFTGAGDDGKVLRSLAIGESLNNKKPLVTKPYNWEPPSAFATYHSTFAIQDNTIVNMPFVEGIPSGMFRMTDYYMRGVERGTVKNSGNRMINSHAGFRTLPPALDGLPINNRNFTLSGAVWDPNGYYGPKNNYMVYDVPFLTAGANCVWIEPAGKNGKSCDGEYYAVGSFQTDFDTSRYTFYAPIEVTRYSGTGSEIGKWTVGDGAVSVTLGNMRHFAARPNGIYTLKFPGKPVPKWVDFSLGNAHRAEDSFLIGVSFDGTLTPTGFSYAGPAANREDPKSWGPSSTASYAPSARWFGAAASLADVVASGGDKLWQDKANNMVWIKYKGGLPFMRPDMLVPGSEEELYRSTSVVLFAK